MKTTTYTSPKRSAFALVTLVAFTAKAWIVQTLAIVTVTLILGYSVYAVYEAAFPLPPPQNAPPAAANGVNITALTYEYGGPGEPPWPIIVPPFLPLFGTALVTNPPTFSFQYGMYSTNPLAEVWVAPGMNQTTNIFWPMDDPRGTNGEWLETNGLDFCLMWTNINTSNCFDFLYELGGYLWHYNATNINGSYVIVNTNLTFVIVRSTNLTDWDPIYTNNEPALDVPYKFTDSNAPPPAAFYRVGFQ